MMEKLGIANEELKMLPAGGESFFSWHGDRTPETSSPTQSKTNQDQGIISEVIR